MTDSYKFSHWKQIPPGTTRIFSFFESRGGAYNQMVFYGLQYFLKEYLEGVRVTNEDIDYAKDFCKRHFGTDEFFNEEGWRIIVNEHGGKLPVDIKAVAEGTVLGVSNVLMTIVNTDPRVPFITNYLETVLSEIWYPCTVATQSREMKKTILRYLEETGTPELVDSKLVDFGYRGSTSPESAGIGGSAHLVNFNVSDNLAGIELANDYYHEPMAGFGIPAAEHMTVTSWGRENEKEAYENMLDQFPTGLFSMVIDSYDPFNATEKILGEQLHGKIMSRDGVLIFRPDSGHPPTVVLRILNILGDKFGFEENEKGYKVLDSHVKLIQGDGIDPKMIELILQAMKNDGWSADNITFGSGGGLLQKVNRDTMKFAFKCSAVEIDGKWHDVMKDPITDPGKKSKAGILKLIKDEGVYKTIRVSECDGQFFNQLERVFENGNIVRDQKFSDVRERAKI